MKIYLEITPKYVPNDFVLKNVDAITITDLPKSSIEKTIDKVKSLNDMGVKDIIPHIASRKITSFKNLEYISYLLENEDIKDILLLAGSGAQQGNFKDTFDVIDTKILSKFKLRCAGFPQGNENENLKQHIVKINNREWTDHVVTQLCLNPSKINSYQNVVNKNVIVGLPSKCSLESMWKYAKLCGLSRSFKIMLSNITGLTYFNEQGFLLSKFLQHAPTQNIHLYNFGNLEKTIEEIRNVN